jgi:hypothetical protein
MYCSTKYRHNPAMTSVMMSEIMAQPSSSEEPATVMPLDSGVTL